jgi:diadenosine tetraphosphate (Ap4A) HIT family hydrolase
VPADEVAEFRTNFQLDELTVTEHGDWVISVRPGQITLGSMVISTSRGELDFASVGRDSGGDLTEAFTTAERLAKETFGAVRINLACLMMKDPIVHFHVLPRYDAPVERYGHTWEDADWPGPPTFGPAPTSEETLAALTADLRAAAAE